MLLTDEDVNQIAKIKELAAKDSSDPLLFITGMLLRVIKNLNDKSKTLHKDTLSEAVALLDNVWNCNCLTDESLGRSKCECEDAPANKSGVRKLMEDAILNLEKNK